MRLFKGYYPRSSSYAIACSDSEGRIYEGYYPRSSSDAIACIDDEGRVFENYYPRSSSNAIACVDDEGRLYEGYYPRSSSYAIACIDDEGRIFENYYPRSSSYAVACADDVSGLFDKYVALAAYYMMFKKTKYSSESNNSGGCFLTTACIQTKNLPDDCEELTVLRTFRDTWLSNQSNGRADIKRYYEIAPAIVDHINALANYKEVYENLYLNVILPCVEYIKAGKNDDAYNLYRKTVDMLSEKYL